MQPAGVQLGKSDGLVAGLPHALSRLLLLGVSERDRRIVALQRDWGRLERFEAALLPPDVWRLGVWSPPAAVSRRSQLTRSAIVATGVVTLPRFRPKLRLGVSGWRSRGVGAAVESRWRQPVMLV